MRIDQYENFKNIEDIVNEMLDDRKKSRKSKNFNINKTEPYQELMNKEDKIIDLMEDIHKYKVEKENKHDFLLTSPLHVIIYKLFNTINDIGNELRNINDINQIIDIFLKKNRLVYTGIIIVILAIIMLLLVSF